MNDYERKQEERRARLTRAAERADRLAQAMDKGARDMASVIPFGQPILIGHHSEGRDRRYRERISNKFRRSAELSTKAKRLRELAASVGSGGVSSDDPDAIDKLRERLAVLEDKQAQMKRLNAEWRKAGSPKADNAEGWAKVAQALGREPHELASVRASQARDPLGRPPMPDYALTNNNANIRRIRERIAGLEKQTTRETKERTIGEVTIREDTTENRVLLLFPGKPEEEVRRMLKSSGFRWSPTRGAWSRMLNNAGIATAEYVAQQIAKRA
jgi:hypothetical protein